MIDLTHPTDNSPQLNAAIAALTASGGGVLRVGPGPAPMKLPVYLKPNVRVECERTRFFWDVPSPAFCAVPECWWEPDSRPGGLYPLCDGYGLILGKQPPVGVPAFLRFDSVVAYRPAPEGVRSVMCELLYEGGGGTVFAWGGQFLGTEPIHKLLCWVKPDGTVRAETNAEDTAHSRAVEGGFLEPGWHTIRVDLAADTGEVTLRVDGVEATAKYGTPTPVDVHWSDHLYFGCRAAAWGVQTSGFTFAGGRIKNAAVRAGGSIWVVCPLTDADGPLVEYRFRYSDYGSAWTDLESRGLLYVPHDTNPVQGWGLSGAVIDSRNGVAVYATNAQNFRVQDCKITGTVRTEFNVYDGTMSELRIESNRYGWQATNNAGQSCTLKESTVSLASGGRCGLVFDSWHNWASDVFVKDIPAGGAGMYFGPSSNGGLDRVNCYNEGGTGHFANVVTAKGSRSVTLSNCSIQRPPGTGPVVVDANTPTVTRVVGGVVSGDGELSL